MHSEETEVVGRPSQGDGIAMTAEWEAYRYAQARAWLEHVRALGERVESTKALIDSEYELMDGIRGIDYSAINVGGSASDDAMANAISKMQAHIAEYAALLSEYEDERHRARDRLAELSDFQERRALTLRYLLGWPWEAICVDMHYTHDGMMKLRRRAIVSSYDVMPLDRREPIHHAI